MFYMIKLSETKVFQTKSLVAIIMGVWGEMILVCGGINCSLYRIEVGF